MFIIVAFPFLVFFVTRSPTALHGHAVSDVFRRGQLDFAHETQHADVTTHDVMTHHGHEQLPHTDTEEAKAGKNRKTKKHSKATIAAHGTDRVADNRDAKANEVHGSRKADIHKPKHESKQDQDGANHAVAEASQDTVNPVKIIRAVETKPPASVSHSTSGARGNSTVSCPNDCGRHGTCKAGKCMCVVSFVGSDCKKVKKVSPTAGLKSSFASFKGDITLNKKAMTGQKYLKVFLPGKEKEPDGGHRTLGKVSDHFLNILPAEDPLKDKIFDSCAIVGSSGIVHHFDNGKEIDEHDMVMRFNSAPTKGFEKFVGSKTTYRITNSANWAFRENASEELLIHMRNKYSFAALVRTRMGDPSIKMWGFHPDFVQHMISSMNFMATSGFYGIVIAALNCRKVDLYGFQVSFQHGVKYHYYNICDQPANKQRDSAEWKAVKALVEAGIVNFREPCILECHESKAACGQCKNATNFKEVTSFGKGNRRRCPACSTAFGGCRPGEGGKADFHWSFSSDWKRSAPAYKRSRSHHG